MKIEFSDSFLPSLKRLNRSETWWYKTYEIIRYKIPKFFRNIYRFRKELYNHYDWDWHYQMAFFRRGLELTADYLEKYGNEVEGSRLKKVKSIRRAIQLMKWHEEDDFLELAEKELGYEYRTGNIEDGFEGLFNLDEETEIINKLISDRSSEIEKETWKELFQILHGQDHNNFKKILSDVTPKDHYEHKDESLWDDWFDGTGLKGWWD